MKKRKNLAVRASEAALLIIASMAIWTLVSFIGTAEVGFTKVEAERKPLPLDAAISEVTPPAGWTKDSFLNPLLPHLGVSFGSSAREVDTYQPIAGHQVSTALIFKSWGNNPSFERLDFVNLNKRKIMPILSWEPWDNSAHPTRQPDYSLGTIIRGEHDTYLQNWAREIARLEFPIIVRFAHEMNGGWYPWSEQRNGNSKGEFARAWRHIHDIFEKEGADNVMWSWAPNVNRYLRNVSLSQLYPGDDYVDVIGFSGYSVSDIDFFDRVYGSSFKELRRFTTKKVLITELGVGGNRDTRPDRILSILSGLGKTEGVIGYIWFQKSKRENWKIDYSPATLRAYRAGSKDFYVEWANLNPSVIQITEGLELLGFQE